MLSNNDDQERESLPHASEWLECEDCHNKSAEVEETICPYSDDVYNKIIPATLCKKCYSDRCADI